jgi:hypothetical protein
MVSVKGEKGKPITIVGGRGTPDGLSGGPSLDAGAGLEAGEYRRTGHTVIVTRAESNNEN